MRTLDAIARILKTEGIENLSAFPTTALIESAAGIWTKRAGVGIADFLTLAQDETRARAAALGESQKIYNPANPDSDTRESRRPPLARLAQTRLARQQEHYAAHHV